MPATTTLVAAVCWNETAASVPATAPARPDPSSGQKSRFSTLPIFQ